MWLKQLADVGWNRENQTKNAVDRDALKLAVTWRDYGWRLSDEFIPTLCQAQSCLRKEQMMKRKIEQKNDNRLRVWDRGERKKRLYRLLRTKKNLSSNFLSNRLD